MAGQGKDSACASGPRTIRAIRRRASRAFSRLRGESWDTTYCRTASAARVAGADEHELGRTDRLRTQDYVVRHVGILPG